MFNAGKGLRISCVVAALVLLVGRGNPLSPVAQEPIAAPAPQSSPAAIASAIPPACREGSKLSAQADELLRTIAAQPSTGAYNALGAAFGKGREFDCAVAAFRAALAIDPTSWEAHNNLALAYVEQGRLEKAEDEFRSVIRDKPMPTKPTMVLGWFLSEKASSMRRPGSSKKRSS
jgi:tetratricopeptide (TPR) repeat protein